MVYRVTVSEFRKKDQLWNRPKFPHITRVSTGERVYGINENSTPHMRKERWWLFLHPPGEPGEPVRVPWDELVEITLPDNEGE